MRGRLGPAKAITTTAHKLAVLVYRILKYGMTCVERGQQAQETRYRRRTLQTLINRAKQMGYAMVDFHSGEVVSQEERSEAISIPEWEIASLRSQ